MEKRNSLNKHRVINTLDTDFKAEIVAAGLIGSGVDADKIFIVRKAGNKRHISKDVSKIEQKLSRQNQMEYLHIHTSRNSLYDAIPENIFHQPFHNTNRRTQEDVLREIRHHRQQELDARHFFQPFEMILDRIMIDVHQYEHHFEKRHQFNNLQNILSKYSPVLKLMTLRQAVFFIKIIPILRELTKDFPLMEQVISIILNVPIKIEMGGTSEIEIENSDTFFSGEWMLDVNSVLGDVLIDGYRDIDITVGPMTPEDNISFYPGGKNELLLTQMLSMMLPANLARNIKFETIEGCDEFRFSEEEEAYVVYLDINTRI